MPVKKKSTTRKTRKSAAKTADAICIHGARQHNLKDLDLEIPLGKFTVITGPSGSGKSSLAFHTLYAEGQRRYVETFSPYVRQFLDRMDKPLVDRIDHIPPAIAVEQKNNIRTTRSTVGTLTELNDYLKIIFPHLATAHHPVTGKEIKPDTPDSITEWCLKNLTGQQALVLFSLPVPKNTTPAELLSMLNQQGYLRVLLEGKTIRTDTEEPPKSLPRTIQIIQDRIKVSPRNKSRLREAIEISLKHGKGEIKVTDPNLKQKSFSSSWHPLFAPTASHFSFNSPIGACPHCRGFGRVIGIDLMKAIPNPSLSINEGCVAPFQTQRGAECQADLLRCATEHGIDLDTPFIDLTKRQQNWLMQGVRSDPEDAWQNGEWYGVKGFFDWLETKAYKMHVRVFLSRYRDYTACPDCQGTRLKPESLCFTINGKTLPDLWQMPIDELAEWFSSNIKQKTSSSLKHALTEITSRLGYLLDVGLPYLTLDRAARTLSGGEIERVNLTTCLGAALTNTLFVLDEPTVGLHQKDIHKLVSIVENLRDKGNTVVVVEHDETFMRAADHLIDLGPAAGEHGGEITYQGPIQKKASSSSLTLDYLSGKRNIPTPKQQRKPKGNIKITGANKHNIHNLDLTLPLGVFTCLTGLSGSGKSTLANHILHRNLAPLLGDHTTGEAAPIKRLSGHKKISTVQLVDQTPLTRTPRSTPALFSGAFDSIRELFSLTDSAREDKLTPGYFSFNSGPGRCQRCLGNGFEKVEMQFLSDLFITCPECQSKRFHQKTLAYTFEGLSIADVLALTITEAISFFTPTETDSPKTTRLKTKATNALQPVADVGLGYLRLGQPLNTLSGGESQRLKLCKLLAQSNKTTNALLILDEPTTGLHFSDIEILLNVLHRLTDAGHTLVVIEHNQDVIKNADHIIELGPGAGKHGGQIIYQGPPKPIKKPRATKSSPKSKITNHHSQIIISGARENNLKNIDVTIPRDELVCVTGLSGSGKSTLAFDIVFAEGQRRFLDSMSPYARQFAGQLEKPDIDRITGLPPTVAIEQRVSRGGGKSTTGTVTEIYHFLRLLYAKLGIQHCPESGEPVVSQTRESIELQISKLQKKHKKLLILAPLIRARKGYHTDVAIAAAKRGIKQLLVDGKLMPTEGFQPLKRYQPHDIYAVCDSTEHALTLGKGSCNAIPQSQIANHQSQILSFSSARVSPVTGKSFEEPDPHHFSFNSHRGWCPTCRGYGVAAASSRLAKKNHPFNSELEAEIHESLGNSKPDPQSSKKLPCPSCHGARLRETSRHILIHSRPIHSINSLAVTDAINLLATWKFTGREKIIARDILPEIIQRLKFLAHVGLGYLQLDRSADTLSGGESQRIRLAAQLGSNLRGVLYVLDEPTIGLHPRDNVKLLDTLEALRDRGNSLLVVEHDEETMRRATTLIELGPGAGAEGGTLVAESPGLPANPPKPPRRKIPKPAAKSGWLRVNGCTANNLKNIDARFPLAKLTVLTGVSGCGKSSLMRGCVSVAAASSRSPKSTGRKAANSIDHPFKSASGFKNIKHCFEVDQTPIGKTSRSCPATYVKLLDGIRQLYAQLPDAKMRGFTASRFSFNNAEGQCPECKGNGRIKLEMDFLPTTWIPCHVCDEMRYNPATLDVRFNGKNIGEVLRMNIRQAAEFFSAQPKLHRTLKLLDETGLGYLQLGQPSPTLSGGEAQRIKLVSELTKGRAKIAKTKAHVSNLYLIEEPSIGLHENDVTQLIAVLHRLVEEGHTVIVIEHNTTIMAQADYIIDIGPEAGAKGGKIVTQGSPEQIAKSKTSKTAPFIKQALKSHTL